MQKDPAGYSGGSVNAFAYCLNNPLGYLDEHGLDIGYFFNDDRRRIWAQVCPEAAREMEQAKHDMYEGAATTLKVGAGLMIAAGAGIYLGPYAPAVVDSAIAAMGNIAYTTYGVGWMASAYVTPYLYPLQRDLVVPLINGLSDQGMPSSAQELAVTVVKDTWETRHRWYGPDSEETDGRRNTRRGKCGS